MDPLRFRKRRLFRQQALDAFVSAFGHTAMPDLLCPPPGARLRLAVLAVGLGWALWIGAAAHPIGSEAAPPPSDTRQEGEADG